MHRLVFISDCVPPYSPRVGNADIRFYSQDQSGWSPLMIAANVQDSEEVLGILLRKDPNVNQKSR